jgi:hypothetical protein
VNLPSERLVLAFGCGIAAVAYVYWTAWAVERGLGWTSVASVRAAVPLAATALLALLLRAVRFVHDDGPGDPPT